MMNRAADVTVAGGSLAGTAITGIYQNLLTVAGRGIDLKIMNTTDKDLVLSLNAGTTAWAVVPAGISPTISFGAAGVEYSGTVSVKHNGAAPTVGTFSVSVIRAL